MAESESVAQFGVILDEDLHDADLLRDKVDVDAPPKPPPRRKRTPTPGGEVYTEMRDLLTGITASMTAFRISLATSQTEALQKLDAEIDRLASKCFEIQARARPLAESPAAPAATMAPAPMAPLNPPPEMLSEPSAHSVFEPVVIDDSLCPPGITRAEEFESDGTISDSVKKRTKKGNRAKIRRNSSASIMQDPDQKIILRRRCASLEDNGLNVSHKNSRRVSLDLDSVDSVVPGQVEELQASDSESMPQMQPRARTAPGSTSALPSLAKPKKRDSWLKAAPKIIQEKPRFGRTKTKKEVKGSKETSLNVTPEEKRARTAGTEDGQTLQGSGIQSEGSAHVTGGPVNLSPSLIPSTAASPMKSSITLIQEPGLFGKMRTEFSMDSVQKHLMDGGTHEMADNRCSDVISHPVFDRFMMTIVILNCIERAISVEFDHDASDKVLHNILLVIENAFCTIFLIEILMRSCTYRTFLSLASDGSFLFDLLLVLLMVWETWFMPLWQAHTGHVSGAVRLTRILRVLRTARMARLIRLMPDLMILIKGMLVACRSVFFTLLLLLIITFVFSIAFLELSRGTVLEIDYFPSTLSSVLSLILKCIVPDQEVFFRAIAAENWGLGVLVLLFIQLGSLTVMNMLLGVLVEAVKTVSTIEREQMMADFARKVLWQLIQSDKEDPDEDDYCDRMISEREFKSLLRKPKAVRALNKLGVDPQNALDNGKMLFEDGESVSFMDFMRAMLMLRGSNKTTVKDMVEMRKYIGEEFAQIRTLFSELVTFIQDNMEPLNPLEKSRSFESTTLNSPALAYFP